MPWQRTRRNHGRVRYFSGRRKNRNARYHESALSAVLPVADNLERAALCTDGESLSDGVKMIIKQFSEALGKLGVEAYGARGDAFDPVVHNAVMQIEDEELGENTVAEVLQKGYKKGDRILRHAVVKVANV